MVVRVFVQRLIAAASIAVALVCPAAAQGPTGRIEGFVRDPQGAVLPGVSMTLRNQDSGVTRTIVTEADGRYAFPALAPGRYSVQAQLAGFAVEEVKDIVITIGFERRLDIQLSMQALQEAVTVRGDAPVVDTTKAEVSSVVTR